jgi:single-stranded DNA-binding protein
MSIEALILGKLHEPAKTRRSASTGRQFVTAKVRASVAGEEGVFVNVVAFSESAQAALLALDAGDSVSLAGTLKPGAWLDREGNARPSVDLVAAQVLTLYGLKKKRDASSSSSASPREAAPPGHGPDDDFGADDGWIGGERA